MKTLVFAVAALACGVACADKVYLKSGSVLSGTVGAAANGEITFKSDDLGDVKIALEKIVRLEDAGEHVVQLKDLSESKVRLSVADGRYVAGAKPLDMANVKAIDPVAEKWHGSVHVAFNAARGNTYENSAAVVLHADRRWEKDRLNGDLGYYYGESGQAGGESEKTTDRWEAEVKHDHFWLPKVYSYEDLKYDRDRIQELLGRYRVGVGGGYQWLDKAAWLDAGTWSFNQELGVNWIKEEYEDNPDAKESGFCALRYAHHLAWSPKWAEDLEVFHNAEILPEVDEWEKFLAKCDIGLSTKLVWDVSLLAKIEWDFNSKPANDRKNQDTRYIVGLGYKW